MKKDACLRYLNEYGTIVEFQYICKPENEYKWFWQKEQSIMPTEKSET